MPKSRDSRMRGRRALKTARNLSSRTRTGPSKVTAKRKVEGAGLRASRQRVTLAQLLFTKGCRHVTADMLYAEALLAKLPISRSTVYNTLHQFAEAGLVRRVVIDTSKTYFDTNVSDHHHFLLEDVNEIVDVSADAMTVGQMPATPWGYEVDRLDILVRLKRS